MMNAGPPAWAWRLFACGSVLGALGAVVRLPYFHTTVAAQMLAAVGQTPEWSRAAAYGRPAPRMKRALAAAPGNSALHIGASSWELSAAEIAETAEPAWCGNSYRHDTFQASGLQYRNVDARSPPAGPDEINRELARLYSLGRRFPNDASVRAYQLRRLLRGPVWIPRAAALTPQPRPSPIPPPLPLPGPGGSIAGTQPMTPQPAPPEKPQPPPQLLERFDAVARAGQQLEPSNGFFDAMRAIASFAGERDEVALHHLHSAAMKPFWNDHAIDETRAVWNLLRTAYGDCGVEQLLPSEQQVAFPHFAALRGVAQVAVWHAAAFERAGAHARALGIRGDVLRLGLRLQDQSPLVLGKEIGDALFYLGMAPATPKAVARKSPWSESERRQRRERYAACLEAHGGAAEAAWVRYESERVDAIHRRIRHAWDGLSDHAPGWPPRGLAVWWEFGVVLVLQMAVILALWGGVLLLTLQVDRKKWGAGPLPLVPWAAAHVVLFFAPIVTSITLQGTAIHSWQESAVAGIVMTALLGIARWVGTGRQRRTGPALPPHLEAQTPSSSALIALISIALPIALLVPYWSFVSHATMGGSIFGLSWWGPPLGLTIPEVAFLPAMLLCCLGLCWGAVLGLPVVAGLCRGVRQAAPYAVALLSLLYLVSSVSTSSANAEATRQMELALTDQLAAMETANWR
jgi:hypothetical protein